MVPARRVNVNQLESILITAGGAVNVVGNVSASGSAIAQGTGSASGTVTARSNAIAAGDVYAQSANASASLSAAAARLSGNTPANGPAALQESWSARTINPPFSVTRSDQAHSSH